MAWAEERERPIKISTWIYSITIDHSTGWLVVVHHLQPENGMIIPQQWWLSLSELGMIIVAEEPTVYAPCSWPTIHANDLRLLAAMKHGINMWIVSPYPTIAFRHISLVDQPSEWRTSSSPTGLILLWGLSHAIGAPVAVVLVATKMVDSWVRHKCGIMLR